MNLVSERLKSEINGELVFLGNDEYFTEMQGNISEKITSTFKGPNGKLKRYVSYYGPSKKKVSKFINAEWNNKAQRFADLFNNWEQRTYYRIITNWSSFSKTDVLLDKTQTAFTIPLMAINEHIIFYDDYDCNGKDVGVFDSDYTSDINCKESLSCENNKAKSVLIKADTNANKRIRVYENPNKKTNKYDYTTIKIGSSGLSEDICISGFQHQTTSVEKSKGIKVLYHNINKKRILNGNISHIKVF